MNKLAVAVLVLATATLCFGQVPRASLQVPNSDIYVGYITTSPDYGQTFTSVLFNGAEVNYAKQASPRWSLVASATGSFGTEYKVRQFTGTVGPKYNFLTKRFRPYATVQAGFAYQGSDGMYAYDHHPRLPSGSHTVERGFTYRAGAGAEWQVTRNVYWRVAGWDVQVMPWGRHAPFYQNMSSGFGYTF